MEKILIFGATGHAHSIIDVVEKQNKYQIHGLLVDIPELIGKEVMGYPVLGGVSDFFNTNIQKGIIAVGDNFGREFVSRKIKNINPNFEFITAIHPSATIANSAAVGNGSVVFSGAAINANATLGDHCIVNTLSSVGHDVSIGNFSTVAPNSAIGGSTTIGNQTAISIGSNVAHKLQIGNNTVIGAGSTVLSDIPDNVLVYGTPAKVIRKREPNEKYV